MTFKEAWLQGYDIEVCLRFAEERAEQLRRKFVRDERRHINQFFKREKQIQSEIRARKPRDLNLSSTQFSSLCPLE